VCAWLVYDTSSHPFASVRPPRSWAAWARLSDRGDGDGAGARLGRHKPLQRRPYGLCHRLPRTAQIEDAAAPYDHDMRSFLVFMALVSLVSACADSPSTSAPCSNPAPLYGEFDPRAPDYMVKLRDGVNVDDEVARLEQLYGFSATSVFRFSINGFAAEFDDDVREMLRCESSVEWVEHDAIIVADAEPR
jgi:hypothetical protein